jgi:ribosomal protein L11 methyltransferase
MSADCCKNSNDCGAASAPSAAARQGRTRQASAAGPAGDASSAAAPRSANTPPTPSLEPTGASEDWLLVSVRCDAECAEAVHAALLEFSGRGSLEEGRGRQRVASIYLPCQGGGMAALSRLCDRLASVRAAFPDAEVAGPAVTLLSEQDWTAGWKSHHHLVQVGRVYIKRSWLALPADLAPDAVVVHLDPQMAFGSGGHESTRLALRALQAIPLSGARLADVGTGTGVLAIAAALLGAAHVFATDCDPIAVRAARANAERNGLAGKISVLEGEFLEGVPAPLEAIVGNISPAADAVLAGLAPGHLRPGGHLILSGFTKQSEPEVRAALEKTALELQQRYSENEWVCLVLRYRP